MTAQSAPAGDSKREVPTTARAIATGAATSVAPPSDHLEAVRELTSLFARSIRRLGQAGEVEEASRLGGKAFVLLRHRSPEAAEHINGVMHFLARLPQSSPTGEDPSCR
jgi:hypothetical protein